MEEIREALSRLADAEYCYLTTTGRVTGRPHEIEIWFGTGETSIYLLSGGGEKSDWVKNLRAQPQVRVRIGRRTLSGAARIVSEADEEAKARRLLAAKYQEWKEEQPLSEWAASALPVAIDFEEE